MDWVLERRQPAIPGTPAFNTSDRLDVIRKHDGTIHVGSEPGRGTTFTVQLPRALERRFVAPPTENAGPAEVKSQ
jgi:hypothetical protein